jgi:hypothetical protein
LAGPRPVRLVAASSRKVTSRGGCAPRWTGARGLVGCQNAATCCAGVSLTLWASKTPAPYSELGFRWQCDEDPALILNTFKWLSRPRKRAEPDSLHRSRTVQVRGADGIFGTHTVGAAQPIIMPQQADFGRAVSSSGLRRNRTVTPTCTDEIFGKHRNAGLYVPRIYDHPEYPDMSVREHTKLI